ncbi:MAG: heme exporter protein CcmB [Pseudomonadota bacterium]
MRRFVRFLWQDIGTHVDADAILAAGFFFTVLVASPTIEILQPEGFIVLFWLGALLACLLAADRLFAHDFRNGVVDQVLCSRWPMSVYAALKLLAWLTVPGMLVGVLGCLAYLIVVGSDGLGRLALCLVVALPGMIALVGMMAALTVDAVRGTALVVLAVIPLSLPLVIFGTASMQADTPFLMLAGVSLIYVSLAPAVISFALADAARR